MSIDIRDRTRLNHEDIVGLNFVRRPVPYVFRRHYRMGLRSHIMEVLRPQDLAAETEGVRSGSLRWFPRAKPLRVLRIFRTRFAGLEDAEGELDRVKIVGKYLGPDLMARSDEFLADYATENGRDLLLCGLQEYVEGGILDPWENMVPDPLAGLLHRMGPAREKSPWGGAGTWVQQVRREAGRLIDRIKRMIEEAGHVPDLAGVGNLLVTAQGRIRLVDINNISRVTYDADIRLDDRGYPACDKSIEALSLLEGNLLGRPVDRTEKIYRTFLDTRRMRDVKDIERAFHMTVVPGYGPAARDSSP